MKYFYAALLILLPFIFLKAQDKTVTYYSDPAPDAPDLTVSLTHINADVSFKPEEYLVKGVTTFTFLPNSVKTDSILFLAPDFMVSSVFLGKDMQVKWHMTGQNLVIIPPPGLLKYHQENILTIKYEANPKKGAIYFVGWQPEEKGRRKVIWAHRPMGWLPYIDSRVTMDMFYTFDENYNIFANGERVDVKENKAEKTKTWHYRMAKNHPFFSTSLVIGDYDYKTSASKGGVPLEFWYYKGEESRVPVTYQYTEAMMDFFEKELDFRYPYPLYRQAPVPDYMYGAMETTTATVFGDYIFTDPHAYWQRNYINTNAHEMAHQWFGNYVCQFTYKDVWLTESFGTYYAKMFEKNQFGRDQYENVMNEEYNQAMQAAKMNNYPIGGTKGGNQRIYQKGSLVLGMLRDVMGETEFRNAVTAYLQNHQYKNATQEEFFRTVYESSGKNYQWFFDEWILRGGEPSYKIEWLQADDLNGQRNIIVHVWQIQEINDLTGLFKMPVHIEVHYKDGSTDDKLVWIQDQFHEIKIANPSKKDVDFILFDPGRNILKKVSFERSFEQLSSQAQMADHMIDRYDALVAMKQFPSEKKRNILISCYSRETFHLTKAEIISQLAADTSAESVKVFGAALSDTDAMVRKAVLASVIPAPVSLRPALEKALDDFSYLNQELALQNLCTSFPVETDLFLEKTKNLKGWRGLNIRMRWLYIAISSGKKEFLSDLIDYTGPQYDFETRINAFNNLKKLLYKDEKVVADAKKAADHWNYKLATAAKDYLKYFGIE